MSEATLLTENSAAIAMREEARTWPDRARETGVVDGATYCQAGELLKAIKALRQRIAETFDPHVRRLFDAHKALLKEKQDAEAPLAEAESILKRALVAYNQAQELARQAEQRRLETEARQREEARRLEEAAALETEGQATGDVELLAAAHDLIERPVVVAPILVEKTTPTVRGIVTRETWSARVTDKMRLLRFVVAHPEYANLVEPNTPALNQLARSLKGAMQVDGVQAYPTQSLAAGAGR